MLAFSILNLSILNIVKVDISELLHTACAHEIRYYKQAFIVPAGKFILAVEANVASGWKEQRVLAQDRIHTVVAWLYNR